MIFLLNPSFLKYAKSSRRGQAETTEAQDRLLAEFIVKSPILFLANGVMRSYFFVFPPYHERNGAKDWGMLRRDYSAKPQVAAFSTLLWELDRAEYLGEYDLGAGRALFSFNSRTVLRRWLHGWNPYWTEKSMMRLSQMLLSLIQHFHCLSAVIWNVWTSWGKRRFILLPHCLFPVIRDMSGEFPG